MRLLLLVVYLLPAMALAQTIDYDNLDYDPLRKFMPNDKLFMPVPAGRMAVRVEGSSEDSIEDQMANRNGGILIGYCLKTSCSWVSHIAVEQICANHIGGAAKQQRLILGIIKMPYGRHPGYIKSLRGRNYAENFQLYGPFEQLLDDESDANLKVVAIGKGPVAPLEYEGNQPKEIQARETLTFQFDRHSGRRFFEIRHLCRSPLS